ncbi:MAG: hypothetical protein HY814_04050 [Candidatus Riflebacteria bacterium]|nr:hypothetical protein [Candidatus Riflebacteria bacterium]
MAGDYLVGATVDRPGRFEETDEQNNTTLSLQGLNLPEVRSPALFHRSDPALAVAEAGPPETHEVRLRRGLTLISVPSARTLELPSCGP